MKTPNDIILSSKIQKEEIIMYLDVDGVLTDWLTPACKLCGVDLGDKKIRDNFKKGEDLSDLIGDSKVWDKIDAEGDKFWLNLELLPWAKKIYKALKNTGYHLTFLSSPGKYNPIPCTPKHEYLMKHFGEDVDIILAYNKWHCAGPNKILIDDSKKKRDAFVKYGGHVFEWPQQFKLIDDGNVDEVIERLINTINELE